MPSCAAGLALLGQLRERHPPLPGAQHGLGTDGIRPGRLGCENEQAHARQRMVELDASQSQRGCGLIDGNYRHTRPALLEECPAQREKLRRLLARALPDAHGHRWRALAQRRGEVGTADHDLLESRGRQLFGLPQQSPRKVAAAQLKHGQSLGGEQDLTDGGVHGRLALHAGACGDAEASLAARPRADLASAMALASWALLFVAIDGFVLSP